MSVRITIVKSNGLKNLLLSWKLITCQIWGLYNRDVGEEKSG